jgi:hypothetical protein
MEDLESTNWTPQILKLNMANLKPSNWTLQNLEIGHGRHETFKLNIQIVKLDMENLKP